MKRSASAQAGRPLISNRVLLRAYAFVQDGQDSMLCNAICSSSPALTFACLTLAFLAKSVGLSNQCYYAIQRNPVQSTLEWRARWLPELVEK
jgi:hypothetical protein